MDKHRCKEAARLLGKGWTKERDAARPGGCFVDTAKDEVFFNKRVVRGAGCAPGTPCVCGAPYRLEERGRCDAAAAAPLSRPECEAAAAALGVDWKEKPIDEEDRPGGCFLRVRAGTLAFNAGGGAPGAGCRRNAPCLCRA